jgi:tRNA(fMet)-specific endonuclease VapC
VRVLLDTNAYAAFKRGDPDVTTRIRRSERVLLSAVVVGELFYGFRHGSRYERNRADLYAFLDRPFVTLLPVTVATADRFGRVAAQLRTKGRPIPTNDCWIAAHAMESGAELLSFDGHFAAVDGLVWTRLGASGDPV